MVTLEDAKDVAQVLAREVLPIAVLVFGSVARSGQGDDLEYGRPNVLLPATGKRDFGRHFVRGHDSSAWCQRLS